MHVTCACHKHRNQKVEANEQMKHGWMERKDKWTEG